MVAQMNRIYQILKIINKLTIVISGFVYELIFKNWPHDNLQSPWSTTNWLEPDACFKPFETMSGHKQMEYTMIMNKPWWKKIFGTPILIKVYVPHNGDAMSQLLQHGFGLPESVEKEYPSSPTFVARFRMFKKGNLLIACNWDFLCKNRFLVVGCDGSYLATFNIYPACLRVDVNSYSRWKFEESITQ